MANTQAPVRFTDRAKANLLPIVLTGKMPEPFVRVGMKGGTCGGSYILGFDSKTEFDEEYLIDDIPLLIDRRQLLFVLGTEIDFEARANGFFLHKPTT